VWKQLILPDKPVSLTTTTSNLGNQWWFAPQLPGLKPPRMSPFLCVGQQRILRVVILQKLNKSHACKSKKTYGTALTMMQISDVDHDASTASTANPHDSPPAKYPITSKTGKNLAKTQRTKLLSLKFEYNVSSSNVQIAQFHGQGIKALIARFGAEVTVYDKDGENEITMSSFPRTKKSWEESFHMTKVTNSRNERAIIIVGHKIALTMSLYDMKKGIQDTLKAVNGFIKINDWGENLDSRSAGFLAHLHPVHHNRETIKNT
jgi:hypothetical protein